MHEQSMSKLGEIKEVVKDMFKSESNHVSLSFSTPNNLKDKLDIVSTGPLE
jgi:hypothetical protein